jgi:hypothetical protein
LSYSPKGSAFLAFVRDANGLPTTNRSGVLVPWDKVTHIRQVDATDPGVRISCP